MLPHANAMMGAACKVTKSTAPDWIPLATNHSEGGHAYATRNQVAMPTRTMGLGRLCISRR